MHSSRSRSLVMAASLLMAAACLPASLLAQGDQAAGRAAVDSVLTDLHRSASRADWAHYFALYAPDAVFFGTDANERWTLAEFRRYATPTSGWTYTASDRHIYLSPDRQTAWFDERLQNATFGECRGTGVLVRTAAGWKIAQYNLTIPIPNDLAREFTARIKALEGGE